MKIFSSDLWNKEGFQLGRSSVANVGEQGMIVGAIQRLQDLCENEKEGRKEGERLECLV